MKQILSITLKVSTLFNEVTQCNGDIIMYVVLLSTQHNYHSLSGGCTDYIIEHKDLSNVMFISHIVPQVITVMFLSSVPLLALSQGSN